MKGQLKRSLRRTFLSNVSKRTRKEGRLSYCCGGGLDRDDDEEDVDDDDFNDDEADDDGSDGDVYDVEDIMVK